MKIEEHGRMRNEVRKRRLWEEREEEDKVGGEERKERGGAEAEKGKGGEKKGGRKEREIVIRKGEEGRAIEEWRRDNGKKRQGKDRQEGKVEVKKQ